MMAKQSRICLYGASDAFVAAINASIAKEASRSDNIPSHLPQPTAVVTKKTTGTSGTSKKKV